MPTVLRALLLAVLLTVAPVTVGVLVAGPPEEAPVPPYTGTPLADYDTSTVALARSAFCDRLPTEAVDAALGITDDGDAEVVARDYGNGEKATVAGGRDVMHEFGCSFRGGRGNAAAWLFAPPVTEQRARELVRSTPDEGCTRLADTPSYGDPSVALSCTGKRPTVSFRGLFGDAWLTCQLGSGEGLDEEDLVDRAGRWCVAVARAATATAPAP
ncbi:hypothetical protein [Nocardioides sambongensis]|uniref:hypothetical protein n=1 Tax=Nocardioides sambongensis TaxID=2589074 RepID=UPI00112C614C|nr:hypothetical protein [Nocardioides sambongensis]